jgi:DNA repair protein RecN (Recombination protein N)
MKHIEFIVDFKTVPLCENGIDEAEFLISANIGELPKPITKIASGGELSRIMLAMKNALDDNDYVNTLIFDEIDTGVSGAIASQMAHIMLQMAQSRQIIAITHLPQVAAKGETHYLVYKQDTATRTETHIRQLHEQEHMAEIDKMRQL